MFWEEEVCHNEKLNFKVSWQFCVEMKGRTGDNEVALD